MIVVVLYLLSHDLLPIPCSSFSAVEVSHCTLAEDTERVPDKVLSPTCCLAELRRARAVPGSSARFGLRGLVRTGEWEGTNRTGERGSKRFC